MQLCGRRHILYRIFISVSSRGTASDPFTVTVNTVQRSIILPAGGCCDQVPISRSEATFDMLAYSSRNSFLILPRCCFNLREG